MTLVVLLACFVLFTLFIYFPLISPPRGPYAGMFFLVFVLFRPCSSYLFPLQHVCCSSCSLSDLLASHSSELLSAFCCLFRPCAGIFFLVFVLFCPCSSCLFLFSTYVVLLVAFLIFLHHIIQNSCRHFLAVIVLSFSALFLSLIHI